MYRLVTVALLCIGMIAHEHFDLHFLPLLTVLQIFLSTVQLWICPNQRFMLFSIQVTFRHICNMKAYSKHQALTSVCVENILTVAHLEG